ncbi:MAG: FKBP-type peptidyl-prolyl cis-trans isomerase [Clostridia bacterium]|nr:FKBP-type peptidyl-prolyl cis-trans isomerase [Clostridia bacterium]
MKFTKTAALILSAALIGTQLFACGSKEDESTGFDYSAGLDTNGFFKNVKASELVTLPTYKGIEVEADYLTVTDADIQEQLDGVLESYATYEQVTDRAVADGDTVNIDYVGSIDGVEFDGGSTGGAGTDVTIGVTQYIDDFLEQLIGHKPGENFDIEVTFPEDYGKDELNGKDAVFNITINYIQGEMIEAELTADIASDYGFDSTDAMLADIESWLVESRKFNLFSELLEQVTCDNIPQTVLDWVIDYDIASYEQYSIYGLTAEDAIIALTGYESKEAYIEANMETYELNAIQYLGAQAIAEIEGLTVTADDIEAGGYTDYVEYYGEPYIKQFVLYQTIIPNFIFENSVTK